MRVACEFGRRAKAFQTFLGVAMASLAVMFSGTSCVTRATARARFEAKLTGAEMQYYEMIRNNFLIGMPRKDFERVAEELGIERGSVSFLGIESTGFTWNPAIPNHDGSMDAQFLFHKLHHITWTKHDGDGVNWFSIELWLESLNKAGDPR